MAVHSDSYADQKRWKLLVGCAVIVLLIGAALIRCMYLTHFPMQIHNDEASTVARGYRLVESWTPYTILSGSLFGGHPSFGFWLASIPTQLTGEDSVWTLRISSAICGTLSLLFFWLFVKRGFGPRMALLFLLFATPFHLHVHYSRTGFIYVHAILLAGLISWAFAMFVTSTSARTAFFTGLTMGLGMLVYPATQVLPIAMVLAVLFGVMPSTAKASVLWKSPKLFLSVMTCGILGLLVSFGPQIFYIYYNGFLSRLGSTFILQPHNIKHLASMMKEPSMAPLDIVWFNILQTAKFFYASDSGEQYNFIESPIPWWIAPIVIAGFLATLLRALKREVLPIYLISIAFLTFVASALMVEGNFSPHLVLFSLLIPFALAAGADLIFFTLFTRYPFVRTVALCSIGAVWAQWNWYYYQRVVDPFRSRITNTETWLVNLPVDTASVAHLIDLSNHDLNLEESTIALAFPKAVGFAGSPEKPTENVPKVLAERGAPAVILVDLPHGAAVEKVLRDAGRTVQRFEYPRLRVSFIYVAQ
jgi:hypothetical protein